MARGVNKAILIGNLGKDPEMTYMPSGDAVCKFSLATSESWKDKATGEQKESTEWHNVVAFKKLAEICGEYLKKGDKVYLEGKIKTRSWEKDGIKKYITEIHVHEMQMLSGKKDSSGDGGHEQAPPARSSQRPAQQNSNDVPFEDDDTPF